MDGRASSNKEIPMRVFIRMGLASRRLPDICRRVSLIPIMSSNSCHSSNAYDHRRRTVVLNFVEPHHIRSRLYPLIGLHGLSICDIITLSTLR